jgi:hypothetical protein
MIINKTFDVVTPESAEQGDTADRGFMYEDYKPDDLRDVKYELSDLGSPFLNDWDHGGATVYEDSSERVDYHTGAVTSYALHFKFESPAEARAFRRVWRMYFKRA